MLLIHDMLLIAPSLLLSIDKMLLKVVVVVVVVARRMTVRSKCLGKCCRFFWNGVRFQDVEMEQWNWEQFENIVDVFEVRGYWSVWSAELVRSEEYGEEIERERMRQKIVKTLLKMT